MNELKKEIFEGFDGIEDLRALQDRLDIHPSRDNSNPYGYLEDVLKEFGKTLVKHK